MASRIRSKLARIVQGSIRQGPIFVAEVAIFWLILLAVEQSGYGSPSPTTRPEWWAGASLVMVVLAMGAGEARFHLYRRVWSVAGLNDAFAIGLAVVEAALLVTIANLLFPDGYRPLRVLAPVLAAPAQVIAIGLFRLIPRLRTSTRQTGNRLLVVIPDASGYTTVKALIQHPNPDWTPIGVVTTGPAEVGHTVMGIPVLGRAGDLLKWTKGVDAQGVAFVQTRSSDRAVEQKLYHASLEAQLPVFIVPAAESWFPRPKGLRLRQLSADDLVGRDERDIDLVHAAPEIRDRTIMVTGAAGSIGTELCRLIAGMSPKRLVLVDINESGLFDLSEELRLTNVDIGEALVSIIDREVLRRLFASERPDVVFHVAAYKHVPMLETHPVQAVLTNVIGTWNTLRCAAAAGVTTFILISTDKATSKHSIMGCTKRLCEQLVLAYRGPMKAWAVRFGNVVGSRGSVVPLFERQIEIGGPVTITHPDVARYMMTIREAASLVLSTLTIAKPGHLYMLDMGQPIKILNLAQDLIRSRGLRPGTDIEITFTGLRPGERMTEELLSPDEGWRPTAHPMIREVVSPSLGRQEDLAWTVERLESLARDGKSDEVVRALKDAIQAPPEAVDEPSATEQVKRHQPQPEQ